MNVGIIYGGKSGEHEISLISASAIARGVRKNNHITLIGITKSGKWYLQDNSELDRICHDASAILKITENEKKEISIIPGNGKKSFVVNGNSLEIDVLFPALHGTYGEDGTIQGLFDMVDLPYVGCTTLASAITMDKEKTKVIWQNAGLPVVPYVCMKRTVMLNPTLYESFFNKSEEKLGYPMFVKPCSAGSSNGASKANNRQELYSSIKKAFMWDDKVLIEKSINAREIECSVTGNSVTYPVDSETEKVVAYIPGEIAPSHTFYDFDAKYNDPNGAKLIIPADLSKNELEKIRKIACRAYEVLDATGLSRVDFFIDKATQDIYLNEINTMPGFTTISMFPKLCNAAGLNFENLIALLLDEAVKRYNSKKMLVTSR